MKGRIVDLSYSRNKRPRLTIEVCGDVSAMYDKLKDCDIDIIIKKHRKKRSLEANAYFHVLINDIATALGVSDDEIKSKLVVEYGVPQRDEDGQIVGFRLPVSVDVDKIYPYTRYLNDVTDEAGRKFSRYMVYKHSSDMDSAEMSRLIDGAISEAKKLGIDTDTPEQKARWDSY